MLAHINTHVDAMKSISKQHTRIQIHSFLSNKNLDNNNPINSKRIICNPIHMTIYCTVYLNVKILCEYNFFNGQKMYSKYHTKLFLKSLKFPKIVQFVTLF
jgi:hypothetical protein